MSALLADLEHQARALLPEERARLAEMLLESLHDTSLSDIEAEWDKEIARRVAAYDSGEVQSFSAEEVFAEARRLAK